MARVVLTTRVDPGQALGLIASQGITLLMGVPTIFQMLADGVRVEIRPSENGVIRLKVDGRAVTAKRFDFFDRS